MQSVNSTIIYIFFMCDENNDEIDFDDEMVLWLFCRENVYDLLVSWDWFAMCSEYAMENDFLVWFLNFLMLKKTCLASMYTHMFLLIEFGETKFFMLTN